MKISHKRIPSGSENSSLYQNTERIQVANKKLIEPCTTKRQALPQKQLYSILQKTDILPMYQLFLVFHIEVEGLMKQGTLQQAQQCCFEFRQTIQKMCRHQSEKSEEGYSEDSNYCESHGEKIKELLEEIYLLRRKLSRLDESLNVDSISSLEQCIVEASEEVSRKAETGSKVKEENSMDYQCISLDEAINNYLQLKSITFELLSLSWRTIRMQMPEESIFLWEKIKDFYQIDLSYRNRHHHFSVASDSLDRISGLTFLLRNFVDRLQLQSVRKNQDSV